jgi:uncharacterized protein YcbK (DUF882 family)
MNVERRKLLFTTMAMLPATAVSASEDDAVLLYEQLFWERDRKLSIMRTQTGESCTDLIYWSKGKIVPEAYKRLCHLFRDVRENAAISMNPRLFDAFYAGQAWMSDHGFSRIWMVNSGHRTLRTNAVVEGAAKDSSHLRGEAGDVWMQGVSIGYLGELYKRIKPNGVGIYMNKHFLHIDTDASKGVRTWRG